MFRILIKGLISRWVNIVKVEFIINSNFRIIIVKIIYFSVFNSWLIIGFS